MYGAIWKAVPVLRLSPGMAIAPVLFSCIREAATVPDAYPWDYPHWFLSIGSGLVDCLPCLLTMCPYRRLDLESCSWNCRTSRRLFTFHL